MTSAIEVLHVRNPDAACDLFVWIDGVEIVPTRLHDVDPGRGYSRGDWDEMTAAVAADPELSEAFREAVLAAREESGTSEYIED
jgi:hypothetical protein